EPGTRITDAKDIPDEEGNRRNVLHYNMLFRRKGELEKVLESFPEFEFEGGKEGHFVYPSFTRERFTQLKDMVTSMGGFFVHPHPCDLLKSDDCSEYVFGDFMGIEVFYISLEHRLSAPQYDLWLKILDKGHRVYACAGTDTHKLPTGLIVTTLYAGVLSRDEIVKLLHEGDFVCGNAGIRMCIGSTKMGGVRKLKDGDILEVSVGDIWQGTEGNVYRADIISRDGIEKSFDFTFGETKYMLIPAVKKGFYRVEVTDLSKDQKIALGNPIWTE
ncbi:MAG: hypothetical protein GX633_03275, partial [Clostridiales bacterium]|nr:hypothetical protein [Clostridiales bacterium]